MSIGNAMASAVSALQAQSQQLAIISNNLANASTTGYKSVTTAFANLVASAGSTNSTTGATGGVVASARQNVSAQGTFNPSASNTNVAIDGNGFFVVTLNNDKNQTFFTRDGTFDPDNQGFLENNGYFLMGWPTDKNGNPVSQDVNSVAGLQPINVNRFTTSAAASTEMTLQANLPADAAPGFSQTTSMSVFDSLGVSQSIPLTWTKSATTDNSWTLTVGNATDPTDGNAQTGTAGGNTTYTVTFNPDGTLNTITDAGGNPVTAPTLTMQNWTDGAADSTIALNMGTSGTSSGVSQFATNDDNPEIDVRSAVPDGLAFGHLINVDVSQDGTVTAHYDNGGELPIYKIPIATFPNGDGLAQQSNNVYQQTRDSGQFTLHQAGDGGAGQTKGNSLEASNVSTADELTLMIVAQQNYSAASQVITTSNTMFQDLIQSVR